MDYTFNLKKPSLEKKSALRLLENAKKDYSRTESLKNGNIVKPIKIFISYQQDYVKIACKIQDIILHNTNLKKEDIFVAHRDISVSEEWRKAMIDELENSTHLLALCTTKYSSSAFGNQEVGYAIARNLKIVPIFWQGTKRDSFGFIESYQSLPQFANENNIEEIVKKILSAFGIA
jgi:superfamily I DNA and RNA helicase